MFHKKSLRNVPLDGQKILVRADYNVPLNKNGIDNDYRIIRSLPTIEHLIDRGCQVIICSHLGRPEGKIDEKFSLEPVAVRLGELLQRPVGFITDCIGDRVAQASKRLQSGQVLLLENLRFYPEEEANDATFAKALAKDSGARYFVQDGFGVVHRAHASTEAITHFLPSVAGLLLEDEVVTLQTAMENPKEPLFAVLGGAKVSDKIKVIARFVDRAEKIIIGGAMANTFLKYKGYEIGKSRHEEGMESTLEDIYRRCLQKTQGHCSIDEFLFLPSDVVVTKSLEPGSAHQNVIISQVKPDDYIVDLGTASMAHLAVMLQNAGTMVWSGTLGVAEQPAYAKASIQLAEVMAAQKATATTIVGGGDTVDFVLGWDKQHGKSFSHVSTGGSASLQLMAGEKLPGIEALLNA